MNAIQVLIVRNIPAWHQIQAESGVKGLLRLCLVGGSSIRVLSATALMQRLTSNPDTVTRRNEEEEEEEEEEVEEEGENEREGDSSISMDGDTSYYDNSRSISRRSSSTPTEHVTGNIPTSATTTTTIPSSVTTFKHMRSIFERVRDEGEGTHKQRVLDDRVRGTDVTQRGESSSSSRAYSPPTPTVLNNSNESSIRRESSSHVSSTEEERREDIRVREGLRKRASVELLLQLQ